MNIWKVLVVADCHKPLNGIDLFPMIRPRINQKINKTVCYLWLGPNQGRHFYKFPNLMSLLGKLKNHFVKSRLRKSSRYHIGTKPSHPENCVKMELLKLISEPIVINVKSDQRTKLALKSNALIKWISTFRFKTVFYGLPDMAADFKESNRLLCVIAKEHILLPRWY